jgi:hypothetical protein
MVDEFSDDEADNLRIALENAQATIFELKEQNDRKVAELEFKLIHLRDEIELEWQQKVVEIELVNTEKIRLLTAELGKLRNAYQGDSSGWTERLTPGGLIIYENSETGQTTYEEPEVLYIAKIMRKGDQVDEYIEENKNLKAKLKELDMKKREAELSVNKLTTEVNFLRKSDKSWREASKTIASNLLAVKNMFDAQCIQVVDGLDLIYRVNDRIQSQIPKFQRTTKCILDLKDKCDQQQSAIVNYTGNIRLLQTEIVEKDNRIDQLSLGIGDELERLTRPLRDRLADTMVAAMKEKANRAQERQELADLWPESHLMPTILMKYRTLSKEEKARRVEAVKRTNAKLALSIEIRRNVAESRMWEMKYDDYGRPFYEHIRTGEVQWEEPEIRRYVPPAGYDTSGNIVESYQDIMEKWKTLSTSKGEVYFQHIYTGEISYSPPYAYPREPIGKPYEVLVGEAAQLVIGYIKNKISSHIDTMKALQQEDNSLLTPDERRLREKEDRIKARLGLNPESTTNKNQSSNNANQLVSPSNASVSSVDERPDDLSQYQYDIETVEMLAWRLDDKMRKAKGAKAQDMKEKNREFLKDTKVREYNTEAYIGPTLYETDTNLLSVHQVRSIVEYFVSMEEKLDVKLAKTRENLKDFSLVLMEKIKLSQGIPEVEEIHSGGTEALVAEHSVTKEPSSDDVIELSDVDHQLEECYVQTMGDLLYNHSENYSSLKDMISPAINLTCSQLIDFSLYCGYTSINIDNLPKSVYEISGTDSLASQTTPDKSPRDDEWLTASYFLAISRQKTDMIRSITSCEYDKTYGIRPTNPLNSSIFLGSRGKESRSLRTDDEGKGPESNYLADEDDELQIPEQAFYEFDNEKMVEIFGKRGAGIIEGLHPHQVSRLRYVDFLSTCDLCSLFIDYEAMDDSNECISIKL